MRIDQDGMSLWFGTADAPAPEGADAEGSSVAVTIAIHPPDASNNVEVLYRVNGGPQQSFPAGWFRTDQARKVQYFRAQFPPLRAGDVVEYSAVCRCVGRQVPIAAGAAEVTSSFRVVAPAATGTGAEASPPRSVELPPPVGSGEKSDEKLAAAEHRVAQPEDVTRPRTSGPEYTASKGDGTVKSNDERSLLGGGAASREARLRAVSRLAPPTAGSAAPPPPPASAAGDRRACPGIRLATWIPAPIRWKARSPAPTSAGVGGLCVQIVDKYVGQDVTLAETLTDERGRYQVRFEATSLRERRKQQPDLQARVYVGEAFLAASDVRYNASDRETLNVQLPANVAALPSEHETLTGSLAEHYDGRLGELKESDDRQDLTYLANKTGWDARAVALAALADQFSRNHTDKMSGAAAAGIHPAFYYALFRAGLPANSDTLYQADPQTVQQVWKRATEEGVIPNALQNELPTALQAFQRLRRRSC